MNKLITIFSLFLFINISSSQTYLFPEPAIFNDSLSKAISTDTLNNIYPFRKRSCTIKSDALGNDSLNCYVTGDIFNPSDTPCDIQSLYTFDCNDSFDHIVFTGLIIKGNYQGNYIVHYPSGYVHIWMTLDKGSITGIASHYYDIHSDKYVGKTYDKGQLMSEVEYKNGLVWNIKSLYDASGNSLKKGTFKNGSGILFMYRPNGTILRTAEIKNGKLNGKCTYFYADESVLMSGTYLNNLLEGTWTEYDENGVLLQTLTYSNGELVKIE